MLSGVPEVAMTVSVSNWQSCRKGGQPSQILNAAIIKVNFTCRDALRKLPAPGTQRKSCKTVTGGSDG